MAKEHWCEEHKTDFLEKNKDGKTWYSHPVKDANGKTVKWCNEKKPEKQEAPPPAPKTANPPQDLAPPFDDRSERIEKQVAIKEIGECIRIKAPIPQGLVTGYLEWLSGKMGVKIQLSDVAVLMGATKETDWDAPATKELVAKMVEIKNAKKLDGIQIQAMAETAIGHGFETVDNLSAKEAQQMIWAMEAFKVKK